MEVNNGSMEKNVGLTSLRTAFDSLLSKLHGKVVEVPKKVKKIGEDDPRRIIHSVKVGLALAIVSVFYYVNPLFKDFRASAVWAVLTVVVVMEFTVGGTLYKGLNRTFATFSGGALALGAHYIADLAGEKLEPVVLDIFIFVLASAATFSRFVPEFKKKYDYGAVIFILTFSLVSISGYRTDEVVQLAQQRLSTISIGVAVCLIMVILVFPVWAGEDLHKLQALNLEKLAAFLKGFAAGYSGEKDGSKEDDESFKVCYKSVLNSKATEEALANFARWEPGHGRFSFRHPWIQYLKIGELSRKCAYSIDSLSAYINTSEKKVTKAKETDHERRIRKACFDISSESSKALNELASGIRTFTLSSTANQHLAAGIVAADKLSKILAEEGLVATPVVLRAATFSSLLSQVVDCVRQSANGVEELGRLAHFKESSSSPKPIRNATVKPVSEEENSHVVSSPKPIYKATVRPVPEEANPHVVSSPKPIHKATVRPVPEAVNPHVVSSPKPIHKVL